MSVKLSSQELREHVDYYVSEVYFVVGDEEYEKELAQRWWNLHGPGTYVKGFEKFYKKVRKRLRSDTLKEF